MDSAANRAIALTSTADKDNFEICPLLGFYAT
jgi:hypothetical protein